jgi:site-specific recombinase XerD
MFVLDKDLYSDLKAFIVDEQLKHGLTGTDTIFHNGKGEPMLSRSVYRMIKILVKIAGLNEKISPHSLRRSFATYQYKSGLVTKDKL